MTEWYTVGNDMPKPKCPKIAEYIEKLKKEKSK
jgi:hypothetical protein